MIHIAPPIKYQQTISTRYTYNILQKRLQSDIICNQQVTPNSYNWTSNCEYGMVFTVEFEDNQKPEIKIKPIIDGTQL